MHVNGAPVAPVAAPALRAAKSVSGSAPDEAKWGSNFWVTLVDPQVSRA